ncbi:SusC/RagA family TonB-linked outer membrane protein [Aridibaculum aurantiacum]|uniref:SusC/RagA family TonB-linked outer membrane protein n=1 Tax=Aridibaculum aurantiacum TaxID=2810307 RepID=UPI001A97B908|nr:TonB-dependent receptor [Aridibaculum aurantiacum]
MKLTLPCKRLVNGCIFLLLITLSQLVIPSAHAQQNTKKTFKGVVLSDASVPVEGASVTVKGSKQGTYTAADGSFTIEAAPGATLVISGVGFTVKEVTLRGNNAITVQLQPTASLLDDVVVVGYGTQRRKDLTGSVSVVNVSEAKKTVTHDVARMLQGQAPGVTVHGSGEPGGFVQMKIRGISTFGNNNPLFIVDGVQMNNPFDLSPNDIESIQVLKDASAGAIYGVRAYAGVVVITTKKAKVGELKVDYTGYAGVQNVPRKLSVTDAAGYRKITNTAELNAGLAIAPGNDPTNPRFINNVNTDWQAEGFKTGVIQDHNIRFAGGNESAAYNASVGYFDQSSTYRGPQNYKRYTINAGLTGRKGIFSYGSKIFYTKSEKVNPFNGMQFHAVFGGAVTSLVTAIPTMPVHDPNRLRGYGGSDNATQRAISLNVIGMNNLLQNTSDRNRALGNFWGEIEPIKNLKYKINLSYDRTDFRNFAFEPTYDLGWYYINTQSFMFEGKGADITSMVENTLTYNFQKGRHKVDLLAGQAFQKFRNSWTNASGVGLPEPYFYTFSAIADPASKTLASGSGTATLSSFFGRANYNFDSRYLLTFNFRRDGTSRFNPDLRWGNFSSVAAAWNIHNEKFIKLPTVISSLKLRGGYGELGNQDIEFYEYQSFINPNASYLFGNTLAPGATVVSLVDPGLKWERKKTTNVALDLGLLQDKLIFTAEYYRNKTEDLLARVPISLSIGSFPWDVRTNAASTLNTGVEMSLQYHGSRGKLTYSVNGNVHTLDNKVLKLGPNDNPIYGAASKTEVGRSVGELYGYKMIGIFRDADDVSKSPTQINAAPGDVKFQDTNKDGKITDDDRIYLGRSIPNIYYGLNLSLGYGQFDFSMFWQGSAGNKVYNGIYRDLMLGQYNNHHTDMLNFWTPTNTNTNIPRPVIGDPNGNARASDRFLQDGSYVRLQNFQLGYTVNVSKLRIHRTVKNARFYVSGQNVVTFTKYKGYDPDFMSDGLFSRGFDIGSFPNPRTITVGAQLSF